MGAGLLYCLLHLNRIGETRLYGLCVGKEIIKYDRHKHHRPSIRLPKYDYTTPGAYFITICSWQRECLCGEVIDDTMQLSSYAKTVLFNGRILLKRYPNVELDNFIVLPNHLHGIILLKYGPARNSTESDKFPSIG